MKHRGAWLAMVLVAARPAWAAEDRGRGSGTILRIPTDARATAMGESFVAVAEEAASLFWNPAGLSRQGPPTFFAGHLFYADQTKLDGLAFNYPTLWGGWALGYRGWTGPALTRIANDVPLGSFNVSEQSFEVAAAFGKRDFSWGIAARSYESGIDKSHVETMMADVGLLKTWAGERWRAGLAVQNIGPSFGEGAQAAPPRLWRAGLAWRPSEGLLMSTEWDQAPHLPGALHGGMELRPSPLLALRLGYLQQHPQETTADDALAPWRFGVGFHFSRVDVDYAYTPPHALGDAHRISLTYKFLELTELVEQGLVSLSVDPAVFSPNGDGHSENIFFMLGTEGIPFMTRWLIEIRSEAGAVVNQIRGRDNAPGLTPFAGKDQSGRPLPDGVYTAQARIWGENNQALSATAIFRVDRAPPFLEWKNGLNAITPATAPVVLQWKAADASPLAQGRLLIETDKGLTAAELVLGTAAITAGGFRWQGTGADGQALPPGDYLLRLTLADAAGNEGTSDMASVVILPSAPAADARPPRLSAGGDEFSAPLKDFFADPAGADPPAEAGLAKALEFLKAHPGRPAWIRGQVSGAGSPRANADRGAAAAWRLYRALVARGVSPLGLSAAGQSATVNEGDRILIRLSPEKKGE